MGAVSPYVDCRVAPAELCGCRAADRIQGWLTLRGWTGKEKPLGRRRMRVSEAGGGENVESRKSSAESKERAMFSSSS